jgi:simple sugar transport system permease protein
MKFASFLICGFFCGLAGVELSLGAVSLFSENMTSGRGIIAFAAVIFGGGIPVLVAAASLLFGFAQALAAQVQIGGRFPAQFVLMTPYVLTMLALALSGERQRNWMLRRVRRRWGDVDEPLPVSVATATDGESAVHPAASIAGSDGPNRA